MPVDSRDPKAPTPGVGSRWLWIDGEPTVILDLIFNGEKWWILTDGPRGGPGWVDLAGFWKAVQVEPRHHLSPRASVPQHPIFERIIRAPAPHAGNLRKPAAQPS